MMKKNTQYNSGYSSGDQSTSSSKGSRTRTRGKRSNDHYRNNVNATPSTTYTAPQKPLTVIRSGEDPFALATIDPQLKEAIKQKSLEFHASHKEHHAGYTEILESFKTELSDYIKNHPWDILHEQTNQKQIDQIIPLRDSKNLEPKFRIVSWANRTPTTIDCDNIFKMNKWEMRDLANRIKNNQPDIISLEITNIPEVGTTEEKKINELMDILKREIKNKENENIIVKASISSCKYSTKKTMLDPKDVETYLLAFDDKWQAKGTDYQASLEKTRHNISILREELNFMNSLTLEQVEASFRKKNYPYLKTMEEALSSPEIWYDYKRVIEDSHNYEGKNIELRLKEAKANLAMQEALYDVFYKIDKIVPGKILVTNLESSDVKSYDIPHDNTEILHIANCYLNERGTNNIKQQDVLILNGKLFQTEPRDLTPKMTEDEKDFDQLAQEIAAATSIDTDEKYHEKSDERNSALDISKWSSKVMPNHVVATPTNESKKQPSFKERFAKRQTEEMQTTSLPSF